MRWALAPYKVDIASSRLEALAKLSGELAYHIVVLDLGLPPDENGASEGLRALDDILGSYSDTKIIVASGNVERANAVRAVARGAFDFITKPIDVEVLKLVIQRGFRMYELEEENRALREESDRTSSGMIFASSRMAQVRQMLDRVGPLDVSVLLVGETGTGKDVVAKALHDVSPRKGEPFIAINCASIKEHLLEIERFTHERGAFTAPIKLTHFMFVLANNGTMFLDEIGDMPTARQAMLLRFLQERKLELVGGRDLNSFNVSLIYATN